MLIWLISWHIWLKQPDIWLDSSLLCPYGSYLTTISKNTWYNERFLLGSEQGPSEGYAIAPCACIWHYTVSLFHLGHWTILALKLIWLTTIVTLFVLIEAVHVEHFADETKLDDRNSSFVHGVNVGCFLTIHVHNISENYKCLLLCKVHLYYIKFNRWIREPSTEQSQVGKMSMWPKYVFLFHACKGLLKWWGSVHPCVTVCPSGWFSIMISTATYHIASILELWTHLRPD